MMNNIELLINLVLEILREKREETRRKLFQEENATIRQELNMRIAILSEYSDALTLEIKEKLLKTKENLNSVIR